VVEDHPGPIEPDRVARDAEHRDERFGDAAVVLQHGGVAPGDTITGRTNELTRPSTVDVDQELSRGDGGVREGRVVQQH
jgi:hypothetical protein